MKLTITCFAVLLFTVSCRQTCKEKIARLYAAQHSGLVVQKTVNNFSLQLSYMPASMLTRSDIKDGKPTVQDTAYYYFKLNVACLGKDAGSGGNNTALYYGLDSLFAAGNANPVLVEPVMTGNKKNYEYLLVFDKKDFGKGRQLNVTFFDRLFTNTKQAFVFDRIKIDEIETLQCYANKA
jgi:hypothetical protein